MSSLPSSTYIVPLYIYPITRETWVPLYGAISRHPTIDFVIVINPNSGPGVDPDGWFPTKHYLKEIPRLNNYKNVTTIGYIPLQYGRRPIDEVEKDIEKYANWSTYSIETDGKNQGRKSPDQAMRGIFLDEVPNIYSDEAAAYLENIGKLIKEKDGILGDRLIVHNPGTVPDVEYAKYWNPERPNGYPSSAPATQQDESDEEAKTAVEDEPEVTVGDDSGNLNQNGPEDTVGDSNEEAVQVDSNVSVEAPDEASPSADTSLNGTSMEPRNGPDITIIFEESYNTWLDPKVQSRLNELLEYERAACCFIVHSVPQDACRTLVQELRERGGCLFVTELSENYYESFGDNWDETIDAIAAISEPNDDSTDTENDGDD